MSETKSMNPRLGTRSTALVAISSRYPLIVLLLAAAIAGLLGAVHAAGSVKPAAWVGDHMVLPSSRHIPISGTAAPGTEVTVEFAGQKKRAATGKDGNWLVTLDPIPSSGRGRKLDIHAAPGSFRLTPGDVAVGDTWLCAGQSNMAMAVGRTVEKQAAIKAVGTVDLRTFKGRSWKKVTPRNVAKLSAVGVWFGVEMARLQKAPVGLVLAALGGTGIEAWIPKNAFPDTEHGRKMRALVDSPEVLKAAAEDARNFLPCGKHRLAKWGLGRAAPASMFEHLVRPFAGVPVRGVVWYQGESNAHSLDSAREYRFWLQSLVASWRDFFANPDLPFLVIQLPDYDPGNEAMRAGWAELQKIQTTVACELDGVWAVETKGLGDLKDIHPRRKMEVGRRAVKSASLIPDI